MIPDVLCDGPWSSRLEVAVRAVVSAGAALMRLRGHPGEVCELGTQLKTGVDLAAEGWVAGYLRASFPEDEYLCEEEWDPERWDGLAKAFWTVDALDGTRSYVNGYDGFCVQVAFVQDGRPRLAAIAEPVAERCYAASEGKGAYCLDDKGGAHRLSSREDEPWPEAPRFVDSTPPTGPVGRLRAAHDGRFTELGSVGLKICRVVDGTADVFAKAFSHKLWDVAPGEVLSRETGCALTDWAGRPISYDGTRVELDRLLVVPRRWTRRVAEELLEGSEDVT